MKILIDMNLSPRWVDTLAQAGFEAIHWSRIGSPKAPDEEILAWAASHGMVLLTHDLDFRAILAAIRGVEPSVVQIRSEDVNPDRIGARVISAITQSTTELRHGAIVSIDPARARVRLLPLGDAQDE